MRQMMICINTIARIKLIKFKQIILYAFYMQFRRGVCLFV
eukprot:UN04761